ncbi:MAG: type II toxin-antitoxin system VapC family toxin [Micrococcales bacterium]|nr:type II toxin-antitoxin system VapC family toxin [Micrococcales bacterium]
MLLLDTCVFSELRKVPLGTADPAVVRWAGGLDAAAGYMSAVTVKELEWGVLRKERTDPAQGAVLRRWLDTLDAQFAGRVLPVDAGVARRAAALHLPSQAPEADAYIAATAFVHGLSVVTRNVRDFARFDGLVVTDPWHVAQSSDAT